MGNIKVKDLHKEHDLIKAAHLMVEEHDKHETMIPALEAVRKEFPSIDTDHIIILWIGVNAKDLEGC